MFNTIICIAPGGYHCKMRSPGLFLKHTEMLNYKKLDSEFTRKLKESLEKMTPEEWEKYFPTDKRPTGWISIEDDLPACMAGDFVEKGYTSVKVKDKDGKEYDTKVCDSLIWYYMVKEHGVTHWWHE